MRVNHRRLDVLVAKNFLDGSDILAENPLVIKENGAECLVLSASGDFANNCQFRQELSDLILAVLFEVIVIQVRDQSSNLTCIRILGRNRMMQHSHVSPERLDRFWLVRVD